MEKQEMQFAVKTDKDRGVQSIGVDQHIIICHFQKNK